MVKILALLMSILAVLSCSRTDESAPAVVKTQEDRVLTFELKNGLSLSLRKIEGAKQISLVLLYDIGGDHDPAGKCGLAHLIEHLYVTAAAGRTPARDYQAYIRRYPRGWNAQTGSRYTVIATVFEAADLELELSDAAARMGGLDIAQSDLDREKPRLVEELENMFQRIPELAAANLAREKALPTPQGGRRGGLPGQIAAASLEDIKDRFKKYYRPNNAELVLAGGFEPEAARRSIEEHFAGIPEGEPVPAAAHPGASVAGGGEVVRRRGENEGGNTIVARCFRAPEPADELYPAFLAVTCRLTAESGKIQAHPQHFPVVFRPLDDPEVITVTVMGDAGESPEAASVRMSRFLSEALEKPLSPRELQAVRNMFGFILGFQNISDPFIAGNPYGVAFSIGRRRQMGVDPAALSESLSRVTEEGFRRAVEKYLSGGAEMVVE